LSKALGSFIYSEGVNSVIGCSGPPRAGQKKRLRFIVKKGERRPYGSF